MSEIAETGEVYVITKNGKPVAQIGPVSSKPVSLLGAHKGRLTVVGDIVAPLAEAWEAECTSVISN